MKNLLPLLFLFLEGISFSQNNVVPLRSSGEVPAFLKPVLDHQSISPTGLPVLGKKTPDEILEQKFLETGTVLFGDEVSLYCQSVLNELKQNELIPSGAKVYAVKSTSGAAFSFNDSLYFVTTGLLAQMTSPVELKFFLLREAFHQRQHHERIRKEWRNGYAAELLIAALTSYSEIHEIASDKYAGEQLSKSGISGKVILRCLDVYFFSDQAFEDRYVPLNYFSSELMYVPSSFFATTSNNLTLGQEMLSLKERDRLYKSRKDALQKVVTVNGDQPVVNTADEAFTRMRMSARMQVVHDKIIGRYFLEALYDIFLLEKELVDSEFLIQMKAHAWYGLVYSDFGQNRTPVSRKYYQSVQGESSRFYKALITLRSHGRALFALRIITDIINTSDSEELKAECKEIRDEIVRLLAESKRFPIERCSLSPLTANNKAAVDTLSTTKYEKLDELRSQQYASVADTNAFYYFAISDLMNDPDFVARFNAGIDSAKTTHQLPITLIRSGVLSFKGKSVDEEKSAELSENLTKIAQTMFVGPSGQIQTSEADQYNEWGLIRMVIDQSYRYNDLREKIIPVDMMAVKQLQRLYGKGSLLSIHFEHHYSIAPHGYHFLGLLLVPLPFMVADLVIGGNDLRFTACVLNTETGMLDFIENSQSRNPAGDAFFQATLELMQSNLNLKK